ncbi:MAG: DUF4260 domain-containing protein [Candidatus Woykebacteria bacterium]
MVTWVLRIEGLAVLLASLYFYNYLSGGWLVFIILILAPDISMIGYLKDKMLGSITYNLAHNYILALVIIFTGIFAGNEFWTSLGLILSAHVGADRFLGFGLKYPTNFKDTHLLKL